MSIPETHPRHASLKTRDTIVDGVAAGVTSVHGLIAQGRGEAFDYLIGEKTQPFAQKAVDAACALLLLAEHPVLSINGNVCALVPKEIVKLSELTGAAIEVNIFHTSKKRERCIKKFMKAYGAQRILMPSKKHSLKHIDHNRRFINPKGIKKADVVFVPLEDGDRCEALVKNGKKVITVDLNPLSRTAKTANVTIVDNLTRCVQRMNRRIPILNKKSAKQLQDIVKAYKNSDVLKAAVKKIRSR